MRAVAYCGLALGIAGSALDFVSGYSLGSMTSDGMTSGSLLAAALYLLGGAVLVTGVLLILPSMVDRMRRLGILMEVFGVLMALTSARAPGMSMGASYAMLIVGALMILNGALMQRKSGMT